MKGSPCMTRGNRMWRDEYFCLHLDLATSLKKETTLFPTLGEWICFLQWKGQLKRTMEWNNLTRFGGVLSLQYELIIDNDTLKEFVYFMVAEIGLLK